MGNTIMTTKVSSELVGTTVDGVKIIKTVVFCLSGTLITPIQIAPIGSVRDWNGSSTGFTCSMTSNNNITAIENLATTTSSYNVINITPSAATTSGLTLEILAFGW